MGHSGFEELYHKEGVLRLAPDPEQNHTELLKIKIGDANSVDTDADNPRDSIISAFVLTKEAAPGKKKRGAGSTVVDLSLDEATAAVVLAQSPECLVGNQIYVAWVENRLAGLGTIHDAEWIKGTVNGLTYTSTITSWDRVNVEYEDGYHMWHPYEQTIFTTLPTPLVFCVPVEDSASRFEEGLLGTACVEDDAQFLWYVCKPHAMSIEKRLSKTTHVILPKVPLFYHYALIFAVVTRIPILHWRYLEEWKSKPIQSFVVESISQEPNKLADRTFYIVHSPQLSNGFVFTLEQLSSIIRAAGGRVAATKSEPGITDLLFGANNRKDVLDWSQTDRISELDLMELLLPQNLVRQAAAPSNT